jgi:hypothetical protein
MTTSAPKNWKRTDQSNLCLVKSNSKNVKFVYEENTTTNSWTILFYNLSSLCFAFTITKPHTWGANGTRTYILWGPTSSIKGCLEKLIDKWGCTLGAPMAPPAPPAAPPIPIATFHLQINKPKSLLLPLLLFPPLPDNFLLIAPCSLPSRMQNSESFLHRSAKEQNQTTGLNPNYGHQTLKERFQNPNLCFCALAS